MIANLMPFFLVVSSSMAFGNSVDDAAKDSLKPLQGGWKVESLEVDGKPSDILQDLSYWWVIKDDKVFYGGTELATMTFDPKTSPNCIDLAFRDPNRPFEGIYDVEQDTLKI